MARPQRQSGFTVVEVLLLLILISLTAFAGYYVWHSQKTDTKSNVAANTDSSTANPSTPAATTAQHRYLIIAEWGVKIPLSGDLTGAYYVSQAGLPNVAYLSVASYKGTNCAADQTSLGAISRFTASSTDGDGNMMLSDFPSAVNVGSYYYVYQHPQAACDGQASNSTADFDATAAAKASALMNEFKTATAKIQAQ